MNKFVSDNVNDMEFSGIRKFYNKVKEVKGALSLTVGQPDFPVPPSIKEGVKRAIDENKTEYTANPGIIELREDISKYLKRFNIDYSKEEICLTVGGSEALTCVFTTILNAGDKLLIPEISYPAYQNCGKMRGADVIGYPLDDEFQLDIEALEALVKEHNPKAMVLCYPSNPTGAILNLDIIEKLHKIIKENEMIVITDEIYSDIFYKEDYSSIAQYEDIKEKIIYVSGFSKVFSMTGFRLGYICASGELMEAIIKVHMYMVSCAASVIQYGTHYGFDEGLVEAKKMKDEFQRRRDYVYERLVNMNLDVNKPEGAFYIFPSIAKFNIPSEEFCEKLLMEKKVAMVPGVAFGKRGDKHIRLSYAADMETLRVSLDRLEEFINELNGSK